MRLTLAQKEDGQFHIGDACKGFRNNLVIECFDLQYYAFYQEGQDNPFAFCHHHRKEFYTNNPVSIQLLSDPKLKGVRGYEVIVIEENIGDWLEPVKEEYGTTNHSLGKLQENLGVFKVKKEFPE